MNFLFINIAYAVENARIDEFLLNLNEQIFNPIIILLFVVALVYFLVGVVEFIANQDNEEAKTKGKSHMIWGIVGIAIMMGVFGIMRIIMNTLNISGINPEQQTVELKDY
jgi:uncharacterized membrane protein YfcA